MSMTADKRTNWNMGGLLRGCVRAGALLPASALHPSGASLSLCCPPQKSQVAAADHLLRLADKPLHAGAVTGLPELVRRRLPEDRRRHLPPARPRDLTVPGAHHPGPTPVPPLPRKEATRHATEAATPPHPFQPPNPA